MEPNAIKILNKYIGLSLNIITGLGVYWIPDFDQDIKIYQRKLFGGELMKESILTNIGTTGNANIGIGAHIKIDKKTRLKINLLYSYAWQVSRKQTYQIIYPGPGNIEENFQVLVGKHRLCLYAEIPIVLFRNKAQKEYYKK